MAIQNFELTLIDGQRLIDVAEKPKHIRIDHNTTVTVMSEIDDSTIEISFRYTVSYGHVGTIRIEGKLKYIGESKEIIDLWRTEHRMVNKIAEEVHNTILNNGTFEAVSQGLHHW